MPFQSLYLYNKERCLSVCLSVCLSHSDVRPIFSPPSHCLISNLSTYLESLDLCGCNKIVCKQIREEIKKKKLVKLLFQVLLKVSFRHHVIPTPCHSDTMSFRHHVFVCVSVTLRCSANFFTPFLMSDFKSKHIFGILGPLRT